jgi:perosamine synthetase
MRLHELPPTAGLPLRLTDLLPGGADPGASLAALFGTPPMQLESSGTAALLIALQTLKDLKPSRRVVVAPAFTCPLIALAVRQAGLELRLCDLRRGHFDMDPESLAQQCRTDTLAVLPTHLAGRVADVRSSCEIASSVGAYVIEDAAQALGARAHGQSVGLTGDLAFFSLGAGKGLSIYAGGLLLTRDAALREALQRRSRTGVSRRPLLELWRCLQLLGLAAFYRPGGLPYVYGLPMRSALRRGDLIGALGERFDPVIPLHRVSAWRAQVAASAAQRLQAFLAARRAQALQREERLTRIAGLHVFADEPGTCGTWPCLLLRLPDAASRDAVLDRLWRAGLGVSRAFVHALPDYPELADCVEPAPLPNARDFAARTLTVGNSHWLDERAFEVICSTLQQVIG